MGQLVDAECELTTFLEFRGLGMWTKVFYEETRGCRHTCPRPLYIKIIKSVTDRLATKESGTSLDIFNGSELLYNTITTRSKLISVCFCPSKRWSTRNPTIMSLGTDIKGVR